MFVLRGIKSGCSCCPSLQPVSNVNVAGGVRRFYRCLTYCLVGIGKVVSLCYKPYLLILNVTGDFLIRY